MGAAAQNPAITLHHTYTAFFICLFLFFPAVGRLGRPEEVASFVVLLASEDSAFVTGSEFVIDGGWTNVHRN